jgi:hypothetical protein
MPLKIQALALSFVFFVLTFKTFWLFATLGLLGLNYACAIYGIFTGKDLFDKG